MSRPPPPRSDSRRGQTTPPSHHHHHPTKPETARCRDHRQTTAGGVDDHDSRESAGELFRAVCGRQQPPEQAACTPRSHHASSEPKRQGPTKKHGGTPPPSFSARAGPPRTLRCVPCRCAPGSAPKATASVGKWWRWDAPVANEAGKTLDARAARRGLAGCAIGVVGRSEKGGGLTYTHAGTPSRSRCGRWRPQWASPLRTSQRWWEVQPRDPGDPWRPARRASHHVAESLTTGGPTNTASQWRARIYPAWRRGRAGEQVKGGRDRKPPLCRPAGNTAEAAVATVHAAPMHGDGEGRTAGKVLRSSEGMKCSR